MKFTKHIKIGLIAVILFGASGCEEFLEEDPKNFISPETFYSSRIDVESALAGVYGNFTMHIWSTRLMYWITKLNNDENENSYPWNLNEPGFIDNASSNGDLNGVWNELYEGVKRANEFIFRVKDLGPSIIDPALKERMVAEAKFLRALDYYFLASFFGDVPLVTEPYDPSTSPLVERTEESVIWDFLRADLIDAASVLPPKSSYSGMDVARANREAAKMFVAKIAMIQMDWATANQYIDEVMTSGEYQLEEDVTMNWDLATEHGKESIFEFDYEADVIPRSGNIFHNHTAPGTAMNPMTGQSIGGGKWGGVVYNQFFRDSFDPNDDRLNNLFWPEAYYTGAADGRYYTVKYWDFNVMETARSGEGPINLVYFRYADLLLMKAEVENEIAGGPTVAAYNAINEVRNRSNVPDLAAGLTYDEFLNEVFDERDRELFYEGHHWIELSRREFSFVEQRIESQRLELFASINFDGAFDFQEHMMVYPIPQSQLDANPKLTQNDGY